MKNQTDKQLFQNAVSLVIIHKYGISGKENGYLSMPIAEKYFPLANANNNALARNANEAIQLAEKDPKWGPKLRGKPTII